MLQGANVKEAVLRLPHGEGISMTAVWDVPMDHLLDVGKSLQGDESGQRHVANGSGSSG